MNGCGASTQKRCEYGHADGFLRHQSAAPSDGRAPQQREPAGGGHQAPSEAGTISRMWRRASIRTGAVQSRPEPSSATSCGVEDREELVVAPVHVVGDAAAIALAREGQHPLDPVPVSLHDDFFLAVLHGGAI